LSRPANVEALALTRGQLADVRIFSFGETRYYVPSEWLRLPDASSPWLVGGIDPDMIGAFDPDLHATECPGVVHQVTDGTLRLPRYAGVSFRPEATGTTRVSFLYAHKLRKAYEAAIPSYQRDGLLVSKDHRTLDAYVRVADDVGIRLRWHPARRTAKEWRTLFEAYSSGPLMRVSPRPWASVPESDEFTDLASAVRVLHLWLATPPNRRSAVLPEL
jgi:hypothetical protein